MPRILITLIILLATLPLSIQAMDNTTVINEIDVSATTGNNTTDHDNIVTGDSSVKVNVQNTINGDSVDSVNINIQSMGDEIVGVVNQVITNNETEVNEINSQIVNGVNENLNEKIIQPIQNMPSEDKKNIIQKIADWFEQLFNSVFNSITEAIKNII